jgi:hypothetical protein
VHSIVLKVRYKKNTFDLIFYASRNKPAETNGGFLEVGSLTRLLAKLIE